MFFWRRTIVSLLFPMLVPLFAQVQGPIGPPSTPAKSDPADQNLSNGLRLQLQDILAFAREHDASKLESLIKRMEIPDYEDWFAKAYGNERGESYAGSYGRDLARNQSDLETLFLQLTNDDGEIVTRKVNDAPAPGMEARMLDGLQGATEIFFASWKKRDSSGDSRDNPIGYFVFHDGSFRLLRAFRIIAINPVMSSRSATFQDARPGQTGRVPDNLPGGGQIIGPIRPAVRFAAFPTCDYCPPAEYSKAARKKHLEGTVVLQAMIQPDGSATDIQVVKSPDPELSQMAMDSVSRWRFNPARNMDGEAVPYKFGIEVGFRLAK
jgi:TonB family protein